MDTYNTLRGIIPEMKKVYNSLVDNQSKQLFGLRLLYAITLDYNYIIDMVSTVPEFESINTTELRSVYNQYKKISDMFPSRKLIIYGAGKRGKYLYELFNDINWHCFCDQDIIKQQDAYCGLEVISPNQLIADYNEDFVVISTTDYKEEIYNELISMGFPEENILSGDIQYHLNCLFDKQYFEPPIISPQSDEVFIDAGCFNFDTSLLFKEWCNSNYEKIYAFEPDPMNYEQCKNIIKNHNVKNVELFNAGLWSSKDRLNFSMEGNSSSSLSENSNYTVNVVSLDDVLNGGRASFIKMDIEGAELEALKGAKNTIIKYRPRLAICIYHKPEDILEIV